MTMTQLIRDFATAIREHNPHRMRFSEMVRRAGGWSARNAGAVRFVAGERVRRLVAGLGVL